MLTVTKMTAPCVHFQKLDLGTDQLFSNLGLGTFSSFGSELFHG